MKRPASGQIKQAQDLISGCSAPQHPKTQPGELVAQGIAANPFSPLH